MSDAEDAGTRLSGQLSRHETTTDEGLQRLDRTVKEALLLKEEFWLDIQSRWEAIHGAAEGGLATVIRETEARSLNELGIELNHVLRNVS